MKKIKVILCALACVLGLTACGAEEETISPAAVAEITHNIEAIFPTIVEWSEDADIMKDLEEGEGAYAEVYAYQELKKSVDGNGFLNALHSWQSAKEEMGDLQSFTIKNIDFDDQGSDIIATIDVIGTKRDAQAEAVFTKDYKHTLKSFTTNINWTFGEKMGKAGLNTLMGMGTVFVVLILISLIISLFGFIPVIQAKLTKEKKDVKTEAVDNTIAQIVEKEEQTDDLELIAVITAAIAASGTSGSSDDFVVRSIRRRPNSQWN